MNELRRTVLRGFPAMELYDQNLTKVTSIDQIQDGGKYLACEGLGPTRVTKRLRNFLSSFVLC